MIYNEDYKILFNRLDNNSIDAIVSDIPYNIEYVEWDKKFDMKLFATESYRVLKEGKNCMIFGGWSKIREVLDAFESSGFILNDMICYDRIKGRGAKYRLTSTREELFHFSKGKSTVFNKEYSNIPKKTKGMGSKNGELNRSLSNVWTDISPVAPMSKEYIGNMCQKPIALLRRIIRVYSNENDLIVDPCMGSGVSVLASHIENRKIIAGDINTKLCEIAEGRLQKLVNEENYKLF